MNVLLTHNHEDGVPNLPEYEKIKYNSDRYLELDRGEVDSLWVYNTLECFAYEESKKILNDILGKVALGGTLTITGYEFWLVNTMSHEEFNNILSNIKCLRGMHMLCDEIPKNFRLVSKKLDGYKYTISFIREN